jgi:hypothetical protein
MRKALKDELASHSTFTVNDGDNMIIDNARVPRSSTWARTHHMQG